MKSCCKDSFDDQDIEKLPVPGKKSAVQKLKDKWQVKNVVQVILIICTFALGGSLCAYCGRRLLSLTSLEGALWLAIYIPLVTVLWPLCVLLISIPLGQFSFFKKYLAKLGRKLAGKRSAAPIPKE